MGQDKGSNIYIVQQATDWRLEWFDGKTVRLEVYSSFEVLTNRVLNIIAWDLTFAE